MTKGQRNRGVLVIGVLAALLIAPPTSAGPLEVVNAIRLEGCAAQPAPSSPVTASEKLDTVARELVRGRRLSNALARVEYPAASSASFHVRGSRDDTTVRKILVEQLCAGVNDPRHVELGSFVGSPRPPSPPCAWRSG